MFSILLALAAPSAVEAERAYAALAQMEGQWTAFRATAAPDALMFVPEAVDAHDWLKDRKNPPVPVMWWPGRSWISCDGTTAVNFGPWIRKGGTLVGSFTTVWTRSGDGPWKWELDVGNLTPKPVSATDDPEQTRASCRNLAAARRAEATARLDDRPIIVIEDTLPRVVLPGPQASQGTILKSGRSPDGSLRWEVMRPAGAGTKAHLLRAWRWDGRAFRLFLFKTAGMQAPA
jgi:hypothetical protein